MALAQDLTGVGLAPQQAELLGYTPATTIAGVGTAQSGAAAISSGVNNVIGTTAVGQTAFVLSSDMPLMVPTVFTNSSSTAALLYPPTGGIFNAQSANASISVAQGQSLVILRRSTTGFIAYSTAEPNILSTANAWTGVQTFSQAIVPTGGVGAAGGLTVLPSNWHTGGVPATASTSGTDTTPSATTTYICAVFVPANATITGVRVMNGSVASGNIKLGLFNSAGANVAATASTAMSGTDAYQQVAFSSPYAAVGPATYYVGLQVDNTTARINTHTFGAFPASTKTGETYGTFTTITAPTTFTANVGPIATLY